MVCGSGTFLFQAAFKYRTLKMTEEQKKAFLERFAKIAEERAGDNEYAHSDADDLLLEFIEAAGHKDVADAWRAVQEEVGSFWYA